MAIATIVFDFGNVVGWFSHRQAAEQLAAFGEASADEILAYLFTGPLEDDYESGRINSATFIEHVCRTSRLSCTPEEFALAYSDMFTPNDTVCSLLPRLKSRYRLLLLSNTTELHSRHFLAQFGEHMQWFDHLVLSHQVGLRKPQAGIYEHCRKLVGCRSEECVFIDDVAANVAGAQACGWQGIVYRRGDDLAAQLARLGVIV
jgi:putative hydrolase of the HAD superfamily